MIVCAACLLLRMHTHSSCSTSCSMTVRRTVPKTSGLNNCRSGSRMQGLMSSSSKARLLAAAKEMSQGRGVKAKLAEIQPAEIKLARIELAEIKLAEIKPAEIKPAEIELAECNIEI